MRLHIVSISAVFLSIAVLSGAAHAETAAQAYRAGQSLLASGDLPGALQRFGKAARADQNNREYAQQYAMLRQVLTLRDGLAKETDAQRWEYMARGLHAFYVGQELYDEALKLDRQIHAKLNTAASAIMLAETALALDRGEEAAEVLAKLEPARQTPATRAVLGVALARQGKQDAAREVAAALEVPADAGPGVLYAAARLHAATGGAARACAMLVRCFEAVPPSQLDSFKQHAQQTVEFASLKSSAQFAQTLQTKSQVPESKCSGGSKCSNCPMRGNCGKSQGN